MPRGRPKRSSPRSTKPSDAPVEAEAQDDAADPSAPDPSAAAEPDDAEPAGAEADAETGGAPRRRGRKPGAWQAGLGPEDLLAYRARFGLSERRLGDYLGVSLTTIRAWLKGGKAPTAARQERIVALLAQDYAAPAAAPARRGPGGRPRRSGGPGSAGAGEPRLAPQVAPAPAGEAAPARTQAQSIVDFLAAYVRTPGGQNLTPDEVLGLAARIQRTLS